MAKKFNTKPQDLSQLAAMCIHALEYVTKINLTTTVPTFSATNTSVANEFGDIDVLAAVHVLSKKLVNT